MNYIELGKAIDQYIESQRAEGVPAHRIMAALVVATAARIDDASYDEAKRHDRQ